MNCIFAPLRLNVFPAGAGVIPTASRPASLWLRVSRRRGGDPDTESPAPDDPECFPQARG